MTKLSSMRRCRAAAAADEIAEALDDDAAAKHVGQARDALAVAVGILERLGKVLADEQGEVGVLGVLALVLVAVAVDGDDAVGVLVDDDAVRVHAEGADEVFKLLGTVDDLALVQLVGQVGEHVRGQFHAYADIDAVGVGGDVHALADGLHPLAAAAADGDDAVFAGVGIPSGLDLVAVTGLFTPVTAVLKWKSTLSFSSSKMLPRTT